MKVLVVVALLVACASASKLSNIAEKLIPGFVTGYVINGVDAEPHKAPYIVSLSNTFANHSHNCGGALIAKDWILTAAHCISKPVGMGIMAGLHERTIFDEKTQAREVDFGMNHELYIGGATPYDIALLHVSQPFELNEWVQPAVLPSREEIHSGKTHLYGWGQPDPYSSAHAETLQTLQTEVLEWNKCKEVLPDNAPLAESNICSDSLQQSIAACSGDSGGPLVIEREGAPSEVIGVVSWGYVPCGVDKLPSVHTRVSAFIDWIVKIQMAYYVLN